MWLTEILTLQCFIFKYSIVLSYLLSVCVLYMYKYNIADWCLSKEYSVGLLSDENYASNLELNL